MATKMRLGDLVQILGTLDPDDEVLIVTFNDAILVLTKKGGGYEVDRIIDVPKQSH